MKATIMKKEKTGMDYLGFALYAFGGLGMEILLMMLETNLWGISSSEWTILQNVIHWTIICIIWGGFAFFLFQQIPKQSSEIKTANMAAAGLIVAASIIYTSFLWKGFKPVIEFKNNGIIKFAAQYVYYVFESMLILLIIVFGQMSFEKMVRRKIQIPAGGILLALTWGLIHIVTQGIDTGIYACVQACLFGIVYLLLDKNIVISYVAIAFMFML